MIGSVAREQDWCVSNTLHIHVVICVVGYFVTYRVIVLSTARGDCIGDVVFVVDSSGSIGTAHL